MQDEQQPLAQVDLRAVREHFVAHAARRAKEQVFVAIVVHTTTSNSDGTLDLHLPVALLDRTAGDVVLVGKVSGATRPSPDESDASERDAS